MPSLNAAAITERFLERLRRDNIFYLLSALLMLSGCYLVCVPHLVTLKREAGGLVVLLGTINVYEALVVFACRFICRNAPRSREGSTLLVVALLFLLDVTFTINACLSIDTAFGISVASASLLLALLKLFALERGARFPVFGSLKIFLIPAIAFLYSFQGVLALYPQGTLAWRAAASCAVWLAFGALPLLLLWRPWRVDHAAPAAPSDPEPWWQTESFKRMAAALSLVLIGLQLLGQTWVHRAPLHAVFAVPLLLSLLAAAPWFVALRNRRRWLAVRVSAACVLLVLACVGSGHVPWTLRMFGASAAVTPFRIDCLFAFAIFALLRVREGRAAYLDWGLGFIALGAMGCDARGILRFAAEPALANAFACVALGCVWLAFRVTFHRAAAVLTLGLYFVLRALAIENGVENGRLEFVRWEALGLLAFWIVFAERPQWIRHALLAAVFWLGVSSCAPEDFNGLVYFYAAAAVLVAACALDWRLYGTVLLTYLAASNLSAFGSPAPSSAASWGWLAIAAAFALFGLAFKITRAQLARSRPPPAENGSQEGRI
ncbi:MAG: hypothetical protein HY291_06535 [Planctomycetes bacterium]|nr:hypothetical protein [Planctomycetota bacterium]